MVASDKNHIQKALVCLSTKIIENFLLEYSILGMVADIAILSIPDNLLLVYEHVY